MAKVDSNFKVNFETEEAARSFASLFQAYLNGSREAGLEANRLLGGEVNKIVSVRLKRQGNGREFEIIDKEQFTALDKYTSQYQSATKTQINSLTSLRNQLNKARQDRDAVTKLGVSEVGQGGFFKNFFGTVPTEQWSAAQQQVRSLEKQMRVLEAAGGNAFQRLGAGLDFGGILKFGRGVTEIVAAMQSLSIIVGQITGSIGMLTKSLSGLQGFALSFKAIGAGASGATTALGESRKIALGLGVNIQTVRDGFQKLSPVVLNSGGTIGDVSKIVQSLSSRFAAFGLNADESRRVMNGVVQAFAKGKLMAEELTQQISEADPAFKTDLAKAAYQAGIAVEGTTKELEGLVKGGRITAQALIDLIPRISKSELLFGKMGSTASSAVDALARGEATISQVEANIGSLNQLNLEKLADVSKPVLFSFLKAQAVITDFTTNVLELDSVAGVAGILDSIAKAAVRLLEALSNAAQGALTLIGPLVQLIDVLLKIPGAVEAVGIALAAKFLGPGLVAAKGLATGLPKYIKRGINGSTNTAKKQGGILRNVLSGLTFGLSDGIGNAIAANQKLVSAINKGDGVISRSGAKLGRLAKEADNLAKSSTSAGRAVQLSLIPQLLASGTDVAITGTRRLGQDLKGLPAKLDGVSASTDKLNKKAKGLGGLFASLGGFFITGGKRALTFARGNAVALIALAGLTFATKAYNDTNQRTRATVENTTTVVKALNQAIQEAQKITSKKDGLKLPSSAEAGWINFGNIVSGVVNAAGGWWGSIVEAAKKGSQELSKYLGGARLDLVALVAAYTGSGALTGASLGGPWGALAGAVIGFGIGLSQVGDQSSAFASKVKTAAVKVVDGVSQISTTAKAAKTEFEKLNKERTKLKNEETNVRNDPKLDPVTKAQKLQSIDERQLKVAQAMSGLVDGIYQGYLQANTGIASLTKQQAELNAGLAMAPAEAKKLGKEYRANLTQQDQLTKKINEAEKKPWKKRTVDERNALVALYQERKRLSEGASKIESKLKLVGGGEEVLAAIKALAELDPRLAKTKEEAIKLKKAYEELKKSLGTEYTKGPRSVAGVSQELKDEMQKLQEMPSFDTRKGADQAANKAYIKQAKLVGALTGEFIKLTGIQDYFVNRAAAGWMMAEMKAGRMWKTVSNVAATVKALETAQVNVDVNTKGFINTTKELIQARQLMDEVDGKRAVVEAQLIEKAVQGGTIANSVMNIKRQMDLLNGYVVTVGVETKGFEQAIAKLGRLADKAQKPNALIQAGNTPSSELRAKVSSIETQRAIKPLQDQIYAIDKVQAADDRATQNALRNLDERKRNMDKMYDKELDRLRELGPAGKALQALDRKRLQKKANRKGRAGLEARAELERMDADEAIKQIERKRKAKQAALDEEKRQIEAGAAARKQSRDIEKEGIGDRIKGLQDADLKIQQDNENITLEAMKTALALRQQENKEIEIGNKKLKERAGKDENGNPIQPDEQTAKVKEEMQAAVDAAYGLNTALATVSGTLGIMVGQLKSIVSSLITASSIKIDTKIPPPPRWSGGPVVAGTTYRVNELGQEGFVSSAGTFSKISRPKNGLWRAPSSGVVIPAHLMDQMDLPDTNIRSRKPGGASIAAGSGSTSTRTLRMFAAALTGSSRRASGGGSDSREMARIQAEQAIQIGKLSRAVNELSSKDWNVNVKVKNTGQGSFLQALNHRL